MDALRGFRFLQEVEDNAHAIFDAQSTLRMELAFAYGNADTAKNLIDGLLERCDEMAIALRALRTLVEK